MPDETAKNSDNRKSSKWLILVTVMLGVIMGPIDASIVNVVLPSIADDFRVDYALAQWVPTIYLLAICSFILFYGRLGDIFGYKKVFLTGLICFAISSLICGFSQNIWMLVFFRALQGLMVAMQMALGLAIVTEAFPQRERGKAIGIYSSGIAVGLMMGPVLGGMIAHFLSWRFVFFINVPIAFFATLLGYGVIPEGKRNPEQRLDITGAVLAFVFLFSMLLYANRAKNWGWFSQVGVIMLVIIILFGWLFFRTERKSDHPMLDLSIFRSQRFSFACLSSLLNFVALNSIVFLTPWFLADALAFDPFRIGTTMMAFAFVTFFMGPISGGLSDRIGSRGLGFTGMIILSFGLFMFSRLTADSKTIDMIWRLAVCGLGGGLFQSPMNSAAMGSAPEQFRGVASSILAMMRNVGMVFGIAISGTIVYNIAPFTTQGHAGLFTSDQLEIFLDGLKWAFLAASGIAILSAISALFARDETQKE
ncbi:MAG: MFS transporter [Deltaproteobacteria bacterium]|nr:MFS transporter [Deltaproteobacteria bacterium]